MADCMLQWLLNDVVETLLILSSHGSLPVLWIKLVSTANLLVGKGSDASIVHLCAREYDY